MKYLKALPQFVAEARKAAVAAAAVLASIVAFSGTPTTLRADAATALAVLSAFGVTWVTKNKPPAATP